MAFPVLINVSYTEVLQYFRFRHDLKSTTQLVSFQQTRTIKRESSEGYISDKSSSNEAVDQLSPEANERAGMRYVVVE